MWQGQVRVNHTSDSHYWCQISVLHSTHIHQQFTLTLLEYHRFLLSEVLNTHLHSLIHVYLVLDIGTLYLVSKNSTCPSPCDSLQYTWLWNHTHQCLPIDKLSQISSTDDNDSIQFYGTIWESPSNALSAILVPQRVAVSRSDSRYKYMYNIITVIFNTGVTRITFTLSH